MGDDRQTFGSSSVSSRPACSISGSGTIPVGRSGFMMPESAFRHRPKFRRFRNFTPFRPVSWLKRNGTGNPAERKPSTKATQYKAARGAPPVQSRRQGRQIDLVDGWRSPAPTAEKRVLLAVEATTSSRPPVETCCRCQGDSNIKIGAYITRGLLTLAMNHLQNRSTIQVRSVVVPLEP